MLVLKRKTFFVISLRILFTLTGVKYETEQNYLKKISVNPTIFKIPISHYFGEKTTLQGSMSHVSYPGV